MTGIVLGCDFTNEHTEAVLDVVKVTYNEYTATHVKGVYGSPGTVNPFGSTRPGRREVKLTGDVFKQNVGVLRAKGLTVSLTFNSLFMHFRDRPFIIDDLSYEKSRKELNTFIKEYWEYVDYWILASPRLVEYFHDFFPAANIVLSTIMNIHTLPQVDWVFKNWPGVKRICPALWKNRDFHWLEAANRIVPLELLANEFCSIGGVECEGLYRQACYLHQTMDSPWNPMKTMCIASRQDKPWAWLMARFILPQWINVYEKLTKVKTFKITGRTHDAEFVRDIGMKYARGFAKGNLLALWGQLEATLENKNWKENQSRALRYTNIPIKEVENMITKFMVCDPDRCGRSCIVCQRAVENIIASQVEEKGEHDGK